MNEDLLPQNADGLTGQAVPSIVEIQDNVQYLKKSVQLIAQVRSLALKSLEFNSFPLRAFHLWPLDDDRVLHGDVWRRGKTTRAAVLHSSPSGQVLCESFL